MYLYFISLLFILLFQSVSAQSIEGTVFSFSDKAKLELTNVIVKNENVGSVTDSSGKYFIKRNLETDFELIFTSFGFLKTIIEIKAPGTIQGLKMPNIYMLEDNLSTTSVLSISGDSVYCTEIKPSESEKKQFYKSVDDIIEFYKSNYVFITDCKVIDYKIVFISIDFNKEKRI